MSRRDYEDVWVLSKGRKYRTDFHERTRRDGTKPLYDNPTYRELVEAIRAHDPESILEAGCGYGRLLEWLEFEFPEVMGCDVSTEMLDLCRLPAFWWDICSEETPMRTWDVVFCRGVFMYLSIEQMPQALTNLDIVSTKAIVVWEWPEVCEIMRGFTGGDGKFEYHEIERKDE